jgi:hypothetical protein
MVYSRLGGSDQADKNEPKQDPSPEQIGLDVLNRDIHKAQKTKLRGTWLYDAEEVKQSINDEFGLIKFCMPAAQLIGLKSDGLTAEQRAANAIDGAFGVAEVAYINKQSRTSTEPTGQVSLRIKKLSPNGARLLTRGWKVWPGEREPRGFYVEKTHVIQSSVGIKPPAYTNSWLVSWTCTPPGTSADGELREKFYKALPPAILETADAMGKALKTKVDPETGEETENDQKGISQVEYWSQWIKLESPYHRLFPPHQIETGDGAAIFESHIGRRPNFKDARYDPAGLRVEFPQALRAAAKKAIKSVAAAIGGEGWAESLRIGAFTFPEPALSNLQNFPVTIVQNKKKNPVPELDDRKTAIRVITTPRRVMPEGAEPVMTHPVEIYRYLQDKLNVTMVAVKRLPPVRVSIPEEKISANVYVFYAVAAGLTPHAKLELGEPTNQSLTTRISLWDRSHRKDQVKVGTEVFYFNKELACVQEYQEEQQVRDVSTQDMLKMMENEGFMDSMKKARESSGADKMLQDEAEEIFCLEADKRRAEMRQKKKRLLEEKAERDRQELEEERQLREDAERAVLKKKQEAAQADKQKLEATQAKSKLPEKSWLRIHLEPESRDTVVAIEDIEAQEGAEPTVTDLIWYLLYTEEMERGGCDLEAIKAWTDANPGEDRVPIGMRVALKPSKGGARKFMFPENLIAASRKPLANLLASQSEDPDMVISINARALKPDKKPKQDHPDWLYIQANQQTEPWSASPHQRRNRRETRGTVTAL